MSARPRALIQSLLPQKLIGRIVYRLARSERPWLRQRLITGFKKLYRVDLTEAEIAEPAAYSSFNAFFTRALKAGARPLAGDETTVVSPVDGRLTEFGQARMDRLLQAKGRSYTLAALLAEEPGLLEPFHGGSFATIYLAPRDYHRVHAPIAGQLDRGRYIPGRRYAVNERSALAIDRLFCRNERVALWLSSPIGYSTVVMVGALNVASLSTAISGEIPGGHERLLSPDPPLPLARGAELGRFNLGSTVVMIFPRGAVEWLATLTRGQTLKMGQALGQVLDHPGQAGA
jgi:phosphatidylserine decarboxylase